MEDVVVKALLFGDTEARVLAARELNNLKSKKKHKLIERGIIVPLVSMLSTQDYDAVEASLNALLNMAFGSERNKILIANSGAIPVVINLLQCQSETLVDLAIAALMTLSSCSANKLTVAGSGAIEILLEILDVDTTGIQAKLDIIVTLHNLSTSSQIIPLIAVTSTIVKLLQLISEWDKSCEVVEKAIALLEKIVSSSQIALRQTAGTSGAIQALVESVEDGSMQCKEHAVGILLLICRSCRERYRGLILREGVMPGLLQLSVDGTRRAKEMAGALLLLLRDCSDGDTRKKLLKNVLMEQVMGEIDRGERGEKEQKLVVDLIAKLRI
ncbi:U-box domain-containing protein 6 [Apium graveolens]|uniref:U-box domain-containing protein 6 n=1 Tax=Apium graveolens TaxID=4045 RepID=UPI003D7A1E7D